MIRLWYEEGGDPKLPEKRERLCNLASRCHGVVSGMYIVAGSWYLQDYPALLARPEFAGLSVALGPKMDAEALGHNPFDPSVWERATRRLRALWEDGRMPSSTTVIGMEANLYGYWAGKTELDLEQVETCLAMIPHELEVHVYPSWAASSWGQTPDERLQIQERSLALCHAIQNGHPKTRSFVGGPWFRAGLDERIAFDVITERLLHGVLQRPPLHQITWLWRDPPSREADLPRILACAEHMDGYLYVDGGEYGRLARLQQRMQSGSTSNDQS